MIKLKDFVVDYGQNSVYYDPAFQRRVVWLASEHGSKFIMSLTRGWGAYSKIVVCDVRRSLKRAEDCGESASAEYFKEVYDNGKGFEFISLDGQNRSKFIESLFENSPTISGQFLDADGEEVKVENKFYKDLSVRLQDAIEGALVDVCVVTVSSKAELAEIFQNLNSGVALNDQEIRNSHQSPIAGWVRRLQKRLELQLARVVHEKEIPRMGDDELVAKMLMVLLGNKKGTGWGLSKEEITQFYVEAEGFYNMKDPGFPCSEEEQERAETILDNWGLVIQHQKHYKKSQRVAAKMAWAALYACTWAYDNEYVITNHPIFFSALKAIDDQLITTAATRYNTARNKLIQAGKDPDTVPKGNYYDNWIGLPHQSKYRNKRIAALSKVIAVKTHTLSLRLRGENKNGQVLQSDPPLEIDW